MTDVIFILFHIILSSVRIFLCLCLTAGTNAAKDPASLPPAAPPQNSSTFCRTFRKIPFCAGLSAALIGALVLRAVQSLWNLPEFYRTASEVLWITLCARLLLRADTRISLFLGIFYETAVSLWLFLFTAWAGVLFHAPAFPAPSSGISLSAGLSLHALLIVFTVYFINSKSNVLQAMPRLSCAVAVTGFLALITLSEQTVIPIPDDTLDMWIILSVVLMSGILVFHMRRQYETEKELARLQAEQAELLERDYTALNNAYAVNARLFHDLHNHIGVLRRLLSHSKTEEAIQYLDALKAPIAEITDTVWTGDEAADYLIGSKAAAAKAAGISFRVQAEFPRRADIKSVDLCAILGNLLDNALEAAGQVPDPNRRFITLTIRRIHQMLVIKAENSFSIPPVREKDSLKTTKTGGGLHGWGLKSVQSASEKYDGILQTSCTRDTFTAVVTLSYQGVPAAP